MEGGGVEGSFPNGNNYNYQRIAHLGLPLYKPRPQITAIDRFLCGQGHFSRPEIYTSFNNRGTFVPVNPDFATSSNGGAIHGHAGGGGGVLQWPSTLPPLHDTNFANGILFNEESTPNLSQEMNPNDGLGVEENLAPKVPREAGRRGKGGSSVALIKGQWTEEEDEKLKSLVQHFGVKKWAQIAANMVGRAGKQCRERWHNHLRPDIKKESWTEEEERLLIEAHMQVGNKWAEIAKSIPGRTENSIKNHWNATKRRQNSRKKVKKPEEGQNVKNQSTILQDYIRSTCSNNDSLTTINTDFSSTTVTPSNSVTTHTTPPNSVVSEDPTSVHFNMVYPEQYQSASDFPPSYIAQHSYNDEMSFMQTFFGYNNPNACSVGENANAKAPQALGNDHRDKTSTAFINPYGFSNTSSAYQGFGENLDYGHFPPFAEQPNLIPKTHLGNQENNQPAYIYSDLYLSHLLDGANALAAPPHVYPSNMNMDMVMTDQAGASVRKEVDLIEMVSNSQFARGNGSNNFVF